MGLINALFGNASEVNADSLQKEYAPLLCEGEQIEYAFKLMGDKFVFTNKRLIIQDTQGLSGKKREYHSIPYRSIDHFSIETAGSFDADTEMKLWVKGMNAPIELQFGRDANIMEIQRTLAKCVL